MMNDDKEKILVSIIMTSYNHEDYIGAAIQSVVDQTYQNWELIIIDDGSADGTVDIIKTFLGDKRIKFFEQKNHGVSYTSNRAMEKATGEVICFLDSDDVWLPEKLEKQIKKYNNGNDIICTKVQVIDDKNRILYPNWVTRAFNNDDENIFLPENVTRNFMTNNYFCKSSVLIKKSLFQEVGYFDERYTNAYDYKKWIECLRKTTLVARCDDKLTLYRWHKNNESSNSIYRTNLEVVLILMENFNIMLKNKDIEYEEYIKRIEELFNYKKFYRTVSFVSIFINSLNENKKITDLIENKELISIIKKYADEDGINDGSRKVKIMENSIFWKMRDKYLKLKSLFVRNDE